MAQGGYFLLTNCSTIVLTNTLTISKSVILDGGSSGVTIAGNNLVAPVHGDAGRSRIDALAADLYRVGKNPSGGAIYMSARARRCW